MKKHIEETLQCLIGQPLWGAGRAADMPTFQFGPRHMKTNFRGELREVGAYALHVQCAWHLADAQRLIVASNDIAYEPSNEEEMTHYEGEPYAWSETDNSLLDERLYFFFKQCEKTPILVQAVRADDLGGVTIEFSPYHTLSLFPDESIDAEYWRFFQTDADPDQPHFVVTDRGIQKNRRKKR